MKKSLTTLALAAGAVLAAAPATAAITLSFVPTATHINVGETITVEAVLSGLGNEVLSAFDLNFLFNPLVFDLVGYTYDTGALGFNQTLLNIVIGSGDAGFDGLSLEDDATLALNQANTITLFTFGLLGDADGASNFTLGSDPDFQRAFSGLNSNPLAVDVGNICISVGTGTCAVPEPGTYGLAGLALVGALLPAALRRRRKV